MNVKLSLPKLTALEWPRPCDVLTGAEASSFHIKRALLPLGNAKRDTVGPPLCYESPNVNVL